MKAAALFAGLLLMGSTSAHAQWMYKGSGDSMLPTINPGALIAVYPFVYDNLKAGMLVTFDMQPEIRKKIYWDKRRQTWSLKEVKIGKYQKGVTHRLTRFIPGKGWRTQGDNNKKEDAGYVTPQNFIGLAKIVSNPT